MDYGYQLYDLYASLPLLFPLCGFYVPLCSFYEILCETVFYVKTLLSSFYVLCFILCNCLCFRLDQDSLEEDILYFNGAFLANKGYINLNKINTMNFL